MQKKLFAGYVVSTNEEEFKFQEVFVVADSIEKARRNAVAVAKEVNPEEKGFTDYSANLIQVNQKCIDICASDNK
jgi:hypothetical protein